MQLSVSKITKEQLAKLMCEEAPKEGWLFSSDDVDFYFNYPRNKIYSMKVDNELAGFVLLHESLSHVQNKPLRSVGIFLVIEKYRGLKIVGPELWQKAITDNIDNDMMVCFHSVPRVVNFYDKLGFVKTQLVDLFYALKPECINKNIFNEAIELLKIGNIKKIETHNQDQIDDYNKKLFPGTSGIGFCDFVRHWMKRPDAIIIAYYDKDMVKGYGIATICHNRLDEVSYRFSPLYADTPTIAGIILKSLVYLSLQSNVKRIELSSLASLDTEFGRSLHEIGFVEVGKNYVVCNQVKMINRKSLLLERIFSSLPLEYPHEVTAG